KGRRTDSSFWKREEHSRSIIGARTNDILEQMKYEISASDISRNAAMLKENAVLLRSKAEKLIRRLHEVEATQHELVINLEHTKATPRTLHSKILTPP